MKVSELIEKLKECPQDLEVYMYHDGDARLECDGAMLFKDVDNWDDYSIKDILVLCETRDVYNCKNKHWFFNKVD